MDVRGLIRDGFPGERMLVLPRPLVRHALQEPLTEQLLVTDCGYFPHAEHHGRARPRPVGEAVVLLCVRGRGWCETESGRFDVAADNVVILPPGEPHAYGADPPDPWTVWGLHLAGQSVGAFVSAAGSTLESPVRVPADGYGAALLAAEVVSHMERDTTRTSVVAASGAAWHLLTSLAASRSASARTADELVQRAAAYLRDHLDARVTVAQVAASAGLSVSHFAALFRERFGVSVMRYQTEVRMSRAREMLALGDQSVAEVAERCGFPDPFYFTRQFRKIHGCPPSEYRRQHRT